MAERGRPGRSAAVAPPPPPRGARDDGCGCQRLGWALAGRGFSPRTRMGERLLLPRPALTERRRTGDLDSDRQRLTSQLGDGLRLGLVASVGGSAAGSFPMRIHSSACVPPRFPVSLECLGWRWRIARGSGRAPTRSAY